MVHVIDHSAAFVGQPGLHVLIAGISAYSYLPATTHEPLLARHYGLRQLSSTATAAYSVFRWLMDHQDGLSVPLVSVRLLLAPSPRELQALPELAPFAGSCTLDDFTGAVLEWRDAALNDRRNMTIFYFAGHGVQRTRDDAVMLMQDFADKLSAGNPLRKAVDLRSIFLGMAPTTNDPDIADTQFYFIDACRDFLPAFAGYEPDQAAQVLRTKPDGRDQRSAPIFYASAPGTQAIGIRQGHTFFSQALIECLQGAAADVEEDPSGTERWVIRVPMLTKALQRAVEDLNVKLQLSPAQAQDVVGGGYVRDTLLYTLSGVPEVDVTFEIDPSEALGVTEVEVLNDQGAPIDEIPMPLDPHPYTRQLPAGVYTVNASISPPDVRFAAVKGRQKPVMPPRVHRRLSVRQE